MSSPCRNTLLCGRNYSAGLTSFAHIYMLMRTIGRILNHTALNRGGHLRAGEREVSKSTSPRCFTDNAFASRCQIQSNECRCSAVQRWSPPAVRLLRLPVHNFIFIKQPYRQQKEARRAELLPSIPIGTGSQ